VRQLRVGILGRDLTRRLCHRSPPFPATWAHSIRKTRRLRRQLISLFDSIHIHTMESDPLGRKWTDEVTVIPTGREERLGDKAL
jgi:hypothetical protein